MHVTDNWKGLIVHTVVSSGYDIPLCLSFEHTGDSVYTCFERLLNFLFCSNTRKNRLPGMQNILVGSDRGYMTPTIVFDFLSASSACFNWTVKQCPCWPYTYKQKLKQNNNWTLLSTKGASTLFMEHVQKKFRNFSASAFCSGTDNISTVVSSMFRGHHWEGIALYQHELVKYRDDQKALFENSFPRIVSGLNAEESLSEKMWCKT